MRIRSGMRASLLRRQRGPQCRALAAAAVDAQLAAERAEPVSQADYARARQVRRVVALPAVSHFQGEQPIVHAKLDARALGLSVLDHVGETFGYDVVGGFFDR